MYVTTWTALHISTLEQAIAGGVLEVYYGDKKVKYNSIDDMLKLLEVMKTAVYPDDVASGYPRGRKVASFDRAL